MEYNENDYDYNDYPEQTGGGSSVKGLKIAIIILLAVLAVISVFFWTQVRQLEQIEVGLTEERDTLTNRLTVLITDISSLQSNNDTLNVALARKQFTADSLLKRLKTERGWNYSAMRKYERELGTLRTAMQGFVRQIDSLNQLNQKLTGENLKYRKEMSSLKMRADVAEETSQELSNKVKRGSQIRAREVSLLAYNKRNKVVSKAKQTTQFATEFILAANDLAILGDRTVYIRIITPDSDILGSPDGGHFTFSGLSIPYSAKRVVEYDGEDLPVSVYYDAVDMYSGEYSVMVYVDGQMIGQSNIILR